MATFDPSSPGSIVTARTSTLDPGIGKLSVFISGTGPGPNAPLGFTLIYAGPGPYAINDHSHFILGFSELSGAGSLYIELGSAPGTDDIHRVDLNGPGDVFLPVADVRPTTSHSPDSFNILRFVFEAHSEQFSFTLDEIRLVPEPSGAVLVLVGTSGLLYGRQRPL